jgi:hypothetical protein
LFRADDLNFGNLDERLFSKARRRRAANSCAAIHYSNCLKNLLAARPPRWAIDSPRHRPALISSTAFASKSSMARRIS